MTLPLRVALLVLVLCAGLWDIRVRRIPNWLTVSGALAGFGLNLWFTPHGLRQSLLGMALAIAVYLPLYVVRGMGAGDVKLMGAVGAVAGPLNWFAIFIGTALLAGACSLIVVVARRRLQTTMRNVGAIASALAHRASPAAMNPDLSIDNPDAVRMPHGAFIASGAMLFLLLSVPA